MRRRMSPLALSPDGTSSLVPLRARDGTIQAYALIDAADADWVNQWPWHRHDRGWAVRNEGARPHRKKLMLHRELLGLMHGDGIEGDHIDRDRLNCRRVNLRPLPAGKNQQNTDRRGGTSVYRGVSWNRRKRRWHAQVTADGRKHHLGWFIDEAEAAAAAKAGRLRLLPYTVEASPPDEILLVVGRQP